MMHKDIKLNSWETLILREAKPSDAKKLITYVQKVICESEFLSMQKWEFTKTVQEEEEIIRNYNKSDNQIFLVALINDEIVWLSSISSTQKVKHRHVWEFWISICKKYWGKWIGSNLLENIISWSKEWWVIKK